MHVRKYLSQWENETKQFSFDPKRIKSNAKSGRSNRIESFTIEVSEVYCKSQQRDNRKNLSCPQIYSAYQDCKVEKKGFRPIAIACVLKWTVIKSRLEFVKINGWPHFDAIVYFVVFIHWFRISKTILQPQVICSIRTCAAQFATTVFGTPSKADVHIWNAIGINPNLNGTPRINLSIFMVSNNSNGGKRACARPISQSCTDHFIFSLFFLLSV